ncbi:MAG: alpha-E domain-containing protein [Rhodobacteraceae bacterium]|nr:alpha-E domain-containing protein [Paracoccaceae bacterium]
MLSRDAQNLYWMSRYIERAVQVCRFLTNQLDAIHDSPHDDIERGWKRIFLSLNRQPAGSGLMPNPGDDYFMLFDAYTLTDDLAFEPSNPDAIFNCLSKARENARQIRSVISHEMWTSLNVAFLDKKDLRLLDIWEERPRDSFANASIAVETFRGIVEATMYRDSGWHFFRLGRFVERALLTCSLIDAQLEAFPTRDSSAGEAWSSLLNICAAQSTFRRLHPMEYMATHALDFLVCDSRSPNSVAHALQEIAGAHAVIAAEWRRSPTRCSDRPVGRARALIEYEWPDRDPEDDAAVRSMLNFVADATRKFSEDVESVYFNYPITDDAIA